jgi:hypothetical protein
VLKETPRHEDVLRGGGIAPGIFNLGTRRRRGVSFTCRSFYPGERPPCTYWIGDWVDLRAGLDSTEKKTSQPPPGIESPNSDLPSRSHKMLNRRKNYWTETEWNTSAPGLCCLCSYTGREHKYRKGKHMSSLTG